MATLVRRQMFPLSLDRFRHKVENIAHHYMTYVSRHTHQRRRNEVTRLRRYSATKEFCCVHYANAVEQQYEVNWTKKFKEGLYVLQRTSHQWRSYAFSASFEYQNGRPAHKLWFLKDHSFLNIFLFCSIKQNKLSPYFFLINIFILQHILPPLGTNHITPLNQLRHCFAKQLRKVTTAILSCPPVHLLYWNSATSTWWNFMTFHIRDFY